MKMRLVAIASMITLWTWSILSAPAPVIVGGYGSASTKDSAVVAAAKFAVDQQSHQNPPTKIKLVKIKRAEQQVVAGMNYKLELNLKVGDSKTNAEVVVWKKLSQEYQLSSWTWK